MPARRHSLADGSRSAYHGRPRPRVKKRTKPPPAKMRKTGLEPARDFHSPPASGERGPPRLYIRSALRAALREHSRAPAAHMRKTGLEPARDFHSPPASGERGPPRLYIRSALRAALREHSRAPAAHMRKTGL